MSRLITNRVLLKDIALVWNTLNALFSMYMTYLLVPGGIRVMFRHGFVGLVCYEENFLSDPYTGFGMYLFVLSKLWELGDTVLLLLRGRPVLFLHGFHHTIVLIQGFYTYPHCGSFGRGGATMNAAVHSIMYSYFAAASVFNGIRHFAKVVTIIQLIQFVVGCYGIIVAFTRVWSGQRCDTDATWMYFHLFVYASFLALFFHFFIVTFNKKRALSAETSSKSKGSSEQTKSGSGEKAIKGGSGEKANAKGSEQSKSIGAGSKAQNKGNCVHRRQKVCYSNSNIMQVSVDAHTLDLATGNAELTNTFQFTFGIDSGTVPTVVPRSYEDGILYLNGRRHALNL
uniref:Elongation of very long chain fatty acids protein n=1 Tax=Panagrellus redivivus TaxID=6233 RepID=A0A7E4V9U8_PANRE